MTISQFLEEHGLHCRTPEEEDFMLKALDKMYVEWLAPEAAIRLILDYLENADEIYSDTMAEREANEKVLADSEEN